MFSSIMCPVEGAIHFCARVKHGWQELHWLKIWYKLPLFLVMTCLDCWSGEWERRTKEAAGRAKGKIWGHWEAREREATAGGKEAQRRNPVPEGNQPAAQGYESCPTHTSTLLITAVPILTSWHSSHYSGPAGRDLHTEEVTVVFVVLWSELFPDLSLY